MSESFIQLPADGDGKKTRTNLIGDVHQQITQVHDSTGTEVSFATAENQLPDNHNVTVSNHPSTFPLPAEQITALTPPAAITGFATAAKQLPDNHQVTVSNMVAAPETGLNKEVTQLDLKTLITTLNSLIETQQELIQRLAPLGAMRGPNDTMRVTGVSMPSTAVTGPITSAQSIAEKNVGGVMFTQRLAIENNTATLANINNTTGT